MGIKQLLDRQLHLDQIEKIYKKYSQSGHAFDYIQEGASLADLYERRSKLVPLLVRELRSGTYEFSPATIRKAQIGGKTRDLFRYSITDLMVHGAFADVLGTHFQPHLSKSLFSYQKGKGSWDALLAFGRYIRRYVRTKKVPKDRHLFVIGRDVKSYSDSVVLSAEAPLWGLIEDWFRKANLEDFLKDPYWSYLQSVVRSEVEFSEGVVGTMYRGIPTGSPMNPILTNLYLSPVDDLFLDGSVYFSRYGDDMLMASPDVEVLRQKDQQVTALLHKLRLKTHEGKSHRIYFTGPGRPSPEPDFRGNRFVEYLGCRVGFDGTVSLSTEKARMLLQHIRKRISSVLRTYSSSELEARGMAAVLAVNESLNFRSDAGFSYAGLLRKAVNDRKQLRQLDFEIAKSVQNALTRQKGVRGFRLIPPKRMRKAWGLISLEHARNLKPT